MKKSVFLFLAAVLLLALLVSVTACAETVYTWKRVYSNVSGIQENGFQVMHKTINTSKADGETNYADVYVALETPPESFPADEELALKFRLYGNVKRNDGKRGIYENCDVRALADPGLDRSASLNAGSSMSPDAYSAMSWGNYTSGVFSDRETVVRKNMSRYGFEAGDEMSIYLRTSFGQCEWRYRLEKEEKADPQKTEFTVEVYSMGNGEAYADHCSGPEGTLVTLYALPDEGYRFKTWLIFTPGLLVVDNQFTIGSSDVLIKAEFEEDTPRPELHSVAFSKAQAEVKENVTITAVTNTNAVKLVMYANNKEVKSWADGYTDQDDKRTWKVTYAFSGAGERELVFYAADKEEEAAEPKTAKITISKAAEPKLTSVKFNKTKATVKQKVTITAVTTTDVTQLNMYSGKSLVQSWKKGYTDKDGKRTWKVTYAFKSAGKDRKLTFKGQNAKGKESAAKTATITITKAPTLSSVKFSKAKAKVKEKVTITAVTSTNATKLTLYAGTKAVKSWTSGYTDKDGKRTWKVTYSFSGAGKRTITFKAFDANGAATAGKNACIEITK